MDIGDAKHTRPPVVGITLGDPAGIGPEVALKAAVAMSGDPSFHPVLIGDLADIRRTVEALGLTIDLCEVLDEAISSHQPGVIDVIQTNGCGGNFDFGAETAETGRASAANIERSVELIKSGVIDAVATAPISKNALKLAGIDHPGHTEFYAMLTGTERFAMSFFAEKLRVLLLTTHVSLLDAINAVKAEALANLIRFGDEQLPVFIGHRPKIAVAGLNPHASEGGMFGTEEEREMAPAIAKCRSEGIDVSGPFSPDTIFLRGFRGEFDLVIASYHDQATIAVKALSFGSSVNVTLGLPIIRTSVDHGTAFDIAGRGVADAASMEAAVRLAAEFVEVRRHTAPIS